MTRCARKGLRPAPDFASFTEPQLTLSRVVVKLVRQITLHFVGGASRKAYEVDLCEVGDGRYVVNFRYGRIGAALRDGTKTAAPVSRADAERTFEKLVLEKTSKGYVDVTAGAPAAPRPTAEAPRAPTGSAALHARRQAVLVQLQAAVKSEGARPLGRLVWRVGELHVAEAAPLLVELLEGHGDGHPDDDKERGKPWLRLVRKAKEEEEEEDPAELAVVETWVPLDAVGTLRTSSGELLRFGASACRGFFPFVGMRVRYDDVEPHPLGGLRARTLRMTAAEERRQRAEEQRRRGDQLGKQRPSKEQVLADRRARLRYALLWSLGRLRYEPAFDAVASVFFASAGERTPEQRIAGEALRAIASHETRARFFARVLDELPADLRSAVERRDEEAVTAALTAKLAAGTPAAFAAIDTLYLLDDETVRPALLRWVRETPLKPPAFQRFRHVFKAAEHRGDWEMYGLCAWRLEKTPAMTTGYGYGYVDGKWVNVAEEAKKPDAALAYSGATRRYLRHRVWRTLRRLGEAGDAAYAKAAAGVLLPFTDDDAQAIRTSRIAIYDPRTYRVTGHHETVFDRFAPFWAFNHVLYRHSERYSLKAGGRAFRCRDGYEPGGAVPDAREEAFPSLWDEEPVAALHLCLESRCTPVLEHAVRALKANPGFQRDLPVDALAALLARPYVVVTRFALAMAEARYDENAPDLDLVAAVLASPLDDARAVGRRWIERDRARFAQDPSFLVRVVLGPFADARAVARELFVLADARAAEEVVGRVIAALLALADDDTSGGAVRDASDALLHAFPGTLRELGLEVIRDLLSRPLEEVQAFGARLVLAHKTPPAALPTDLIPWLMNARFAQVRAVGVRLFGALPDDELPQRLGLFRDLCTSPLDDVRAAVRPVLARLAPHHPAFVADLATLLVPPLLRKERAEGLHRDVAAMILEDLAGGLSWAKADLVFKLLASRWPAAQTVGAALLDENLVPDALPVDRMISLLSHELSRVRESARALLERSLPRLKASMEETVRALDASWDDSRAWAFRFFEERFDEDDFTPVVLVGICDSVRDDVQHFGMKLVARYFKEPYGPEYLLKLSEHPSANLQLYATNYLERFATGDVARLEALAPFFLAVLSRVNKGRVAKQRVLSFLAEEATRDQPSARLVADVLTRQSLTLAIGDKARCLETLADIHRRWPHVAVPVVVKPVPVREVRRGV